MTMKALMGNDTVCYFCYKKRRRADKDVIRKLSKLFDVKKINGEWVKDGVFLYRVTRRKSISGADQAEDGQELRD